MHESKEQRWRGWHEARVAVAVLDSGTQWCRRRACDLRPYCYMERSNPSGWMHFWLHARVCVCMAETYAKWRLDTRIIEVHSTTLFPCPQQKEFLPCPQQKHTRGFLHAVQTRFAQSRAGSGALPTELCPRSLHIFTSSSLAIRGYQGPVTPSTTSARVRRT
mgnify:CR=1 FL=1